MPRISEFFGITIYMYFKEHNPPHFHANYNEFNAQICINDFRVLHGFLPSKALSIVIEWASSHQKELMENWKLIQDGKSWIKIDPL